MTCVVHPAGITINDNVSYADSHAGVLRIDKDVPRELVGDAGS